MGEDVRSVISLSQRTLFETSAVGIAITDGSGTVLECNGKLASMLGYDGPEELVGAPGADTGTSELEAQYPRKDGTPVWLKVRVAPIAGTALFFCFFEDVTDRRTAEEALAEHAVLLERAQAVGGVGSWIWYPEEGRNVWSEQAARIFGFSPEEVASQDPELFFSVIHPDDSDRISAIAWHTFDSTSPTEVEYRIVRRSDGEVRWVREQGVVEHDAWGRPYRMVGAVADITEHKLAELDAARKTTLLESAHAVAGLGAYVVDLGRQTILVSAELARLLRVGDEAFELPLAEYRRRFYLPDRVNTAAAESDDRYARGDQNLRLEGQLVRGDGEVIWVRSLEGRTEFMGESLMLGVTQDVTDQKHVELELIETAAGLERAQQLGRVGTWAWYPGDRRTIYSTEALRMMGYPLDAEGPGLLTNVLHPDDAREMSRRSEEAFAAGVPYSDEFRIVRDGEVRWLHVQGDVEAGSDGAPWRMVGVLMDITDKRSVDEERGELLERLRQSQKLDALGQLAGGVAHDFNNLLTVISGSATLALMEAHEDSLRANLGEIVHAATRASELTQKLLVFARRQPLEKKSLDLNDVVADSRRLLERLIGPSIEIEERLSDAPLPVVADMGQLEQVLLNLALNARDAMPRGGRLTIRTDTDEGHRHGVISVEDTGSGIPPAALERIFEPFFTTKEAGKGTGLGLATVYGIVDAAGGEISVESDEGAGTVFTVKLPLTGARDPGDPEPLELEAAGLRSRGLRALLVDDDDHVRTTLTRLLRAAGCSSVVAVRSGNEALDVIADDEAFDVVVTDLMMPQMNGVDLSRELREHVPGMPVLYISGSSENATLAASQPNSLFLAKPFTVSEIAGSLGRLVPPHRALTR
jgi:two-component system, cell cycle sensor histidine kinase and response regulator CckA